MRVKCRQTRLSIEQLALLGIDRVRQEPNVTLEKEYTVVGLDFFLGSRPFGTGVWVHLVDDEDHLAWVPLCLFEVVDGRVSKYWIARYSNGNLSLWPDPLYREYFHDDLSESDPVAVAEFRQVLQALELENAL